jgi:predicted nucleotidyltransferase
LRSVDECYRGRNVRVFRLDREGVVASLRERAAGVLAARSDVLEVRLFGSLARGDAVPGSDADLFVLLTNDGAPPFLDRLPPLLRDFSGLGIGCEIIAYTASEYAEARTRGDALVKAVDEEGLVLARRGGSLGDT